MPRLSQWWHVGFALSLVLSLTRSALHVMDVTQLDVGKPPVQLSPVEERIIDQQAKSALNEVNTVAERAVNEVMQYDKGGPKPAGTRSERHDAANKIASLLDAKIQHATAQANAIMNEASGEEAAFKAEADDILSRAKHAAKEEIHRAESKALADTKPLQIPVHHPRFNQISNGSMNTSMHNVSRNSTIAQLAAEWEGAKQQREVAKIHKEYVEENLQRWNQDHDLRTERLDSRAMAELPQDISDDET